MKTYKPRNRDKLLEQANANSLHTLIKSKVTIAEKREVIERTNPLLYALGERLTPHDHYNISNPHNPISVSYADYINHEYLGEVEAQAQGEYK